MLDDTPISPELALIDPEFARPVALEDWPVIDPLDPQQSAPESKGGATLMAAPNTPSVETLLFGAGVISADQLGELVRDAVLARRAVAAVALERGLVTVQTLQALLVQAGTGVTLEELLGEATDVSVPATAAAPEPIPAQTETPRLSVAAPAPVPPSEIPSLDPIAAPAPGQWAAADDDVVAVLPTVRAVAAAVASALPDEAPHAPAPSGPVLPPASHLVPAPLAAAAQGFRLLLRLQGGERVGVDCAATYEDAAELARTIAQRFATTTEWPLVAGRCIRPDAVVSVDIERALGA